MLHSGKVCPQESPGWVNHRISVWDDFVGLTRTRTRRPVNAPAPGCIPSTSVWRLGLGIRARARLRGHVYVYGPTASTPMGTPLAACASLGRLSALSLRIYPGG